MEPLYEKYISWSPYNYGGLNPIKLIDINGLDLTLGGEINVALNDLKSLFSDVAIQDRITLDKDKVSFDVSGLDVNSDAAIELLDNIINKSDKKYLYEVNDITYGIARQDFPNGIKKGGQIIEARDGAANFSKNPRNINGGMGSVGPLPKDGYDGQVTLGQGTFTTLKNRKVVEDRWNLVFHELAENYFRTDGNQPYIRSDLSGAHKSAIHAAKNFKRNTSAQPGSGVYNPCN